MVTDTTTGQSDDTTAFLRAARSGNLEKVVEYLDKSLDINTANSNGLNALHLASKDGHVEIVTELLKRGAKVDAATKKGNTALHIASLAGQSEIVNILIQYGAAVNIQSQNGFTPLYMAAQENHDQVVKLLLSNGANQTLATEDGFTPLAVAMQQGHDKVVSVLLENDSKGKVRLPALHIAAKKDDCKAADLLLQNDHKPDVTSKSGFTPLHIAAHYGNEEIGRLLIKKGADVNYLAKHNISPLHVAAKWGKNNMVKLLLENSSMIDAKTRDGLTPLHCAARSGHEEVVSTLLEQSAPISARTKNGLAPLHMASQGDHVEAARVLLYHRAPVDEVTIDYLTSLHVAAHCGHVRVAKLLLDRKADPNARALNGFTPLHIACKKNRIKVVELLLKHGASIESTTESGLTPLHVASFMGCMNIVIFLLQHEANPDVPTVRGETPLHLAARANQTDIIRILLRNGAKVDARAREEQTPLHIASRLGNVDIVMLLLQHGAAVDTTTKDMYTALHIAAKEGQEEVAAILVENKASVTATTKNGFTPLHIAAKYGNMNVAKILLQKDSKLDAQGKNNITPLHLACHYDHPEVATMILEKGASPHLSSQNGHTPLHIAARKNQMEIASTLLEHGANPNTESKAGFTPLQLSAQKGHYDMTNLLIEHGANANHKSKSGLTALHMCAQEDFIRVASVLVKNNANVESETETGYRPIHVAAHFGNLSMIKFLLKHNAQIDVGTSHNYTPLHQAAQQGHAHIATALLEGNAKHNARTNDGLTALNIAQKLGYISVMEVLKGLKYDEQTPDNKYWEEKYKVIAPESIQESSFMSDSDDEGGSDALINEQPYRYLTADLMKSLRDDSLPIDVTRDDPVHRPVTKVEIKEFTQSNNYCLAENFDSTDAINVGRLNIKSFLVSFLVDARGGAMKGCRHSGIKILIPPRRATMPIRITCRLIKSNKLTNPPVLMEGEALATRIIEMGPSGASFLGPVLIDVPHFAAIQGKDREIIILRSDNGENWKEHDNTHENDDALFNLAPDLQMNSIYLGRITRIITTEFPQYFAIITRIKQEVHVIGSDGGILISSVANHVQAVFPPGALTKKIKVGLQAHVIPAELTAKLLGNCVAVSPVITIEPRRRKFHKPITLTIPVPQAANKGMINNYAGETPTLRLLCSIAGGTSEAQWEDVTGSTPLTFLNDRVSFTTTVSARFWLMDCRNISEVPKMATELYKESLFVPFITNFIIYTKRMDILEATLRILCMTDGKETMHTLERQEEFLEIVKSRDVEALDGKDLYIEFSGNLVPVTKSGQQLKFTFKAFRQNRLSFNVKVRDPLLDPVARMMFMKDPKVAKGEAPQQPICVLNIVLPEEISSKTESDLRQKELDLNLITKMDIYKSTYMRDYGEKRDIPKPTSPHEKKIIIDILQNEQTDAESFDKKLACTLESVDASYPNDLSTQEAMSPELERQTYSEKRRFWEDITKKRDSYQLSESELSRASQITVNESDSEYLHSIVSEGEEMEAMPERSETLEDLNIPDISECTVAEKAHYFEEQIQKELSAASAKALTKITSQESFRERRKSSIDAAQLLEEYPTSNDMKTTKIDLVVENKIEKIEGTSGEKVWEQTKVTEKIEITGDGKPTMIPRKIISEEKIITQVSSDIKRPVTAPRTLKPETSGESVKQEQENAVNEKKETKVLKSEINKIDFVKDKNISADFIASESKFSQEEITSVTEIMKKENLIEEKNSNESTLPEIKINKDNFNEDKNICSKLLESESNFSQKEITSVSEIKNKELIETKITNEPKVPSMIPVKTKAEHINKFDLKKESKIPVPPVKIESSTSVEKNLPHSPKEATKIPNLSEQKAEKVICDLPKKEEKIATDSVSFPKETADLKKEPFDSMKKDSKIPLFERESSDLSNKNLIKKETKIPEPSTKAIDKSELKKEEVEIKTTSSITQDSSDNLEKKLDTSTVVLSPPATPVLKREPSDLLKKDSKIPVLKREASDLTKKESTSPKEVTKKEEVMTEIKQEISLVKKEIVEVVKKETKEAVLTNLPEFKRESSDLSKKDSKIPVLKREPSDVTKKEPLTLSSPIAKEIPGIKREPSDLSKKDSKIPVLKREPSDLIKKETTTPGSPVAKEILGLRREPSDLSKQDTKIPTLKREPSDLSKKKSTPGSPISKEIPGLKREPSDLSKQDTKIPTLKREPSDLTKKKSTPGSPISKEIPGLRREPSDLSKQDTKIPTLKREPSDLTKKKSSAPGSPISKEIPGLRREPSDLSKQDTKIPTLKREPSDLSKKKSSTPGSPIARETPGLKREPSDLSKKDSKIPIFKREPSDLTKKDSASGASSPKEMPGLRREPSDLSKQDTKIPTLKREPSDLSKKDSKIPAMKREGSDLSKKDSRIPTFKREPSDLTKKDSTKIQSPSGIQGPSLLKREPSDLTKKDSKIPSMKRETSDLSKKDSKIPTLKREPSDLSKKDSKIPSMKREGSDLSKKDSKIPVFKREPSDLSEKDLSKESKIPSRRESLTKTDKDKQAKPKIESKIPKMKFGESGPSKSLEKTGKNETSITATKITEKKSEHIETTMSEKKTQSQTITKTFTDPVEALKEFEEMERLFNAAPGVTTSKIDHEESKLLEKKEIISSEISRGDEKILKVQEKDQKLEEKKIESICKKETDDEIVEDKLSSQKISDKNQTQNISVLVSGDKQFINASASQSMNLAKDQERIQSRDDDDGIFVQETGSSTIKNKKIDMALSLEKDTPKISGQKDIDMFDLGMSLRDELKTAVIGEQSHVESTERNETKMYPSRETSSQDYSQASETLEEHQQRVFEEHEARNIAENIVQQIEEEIVKRSESSDGLNHKLLESSTEKINDKIDNEPEDYDDQLADDLTEKFENLIGGKRKESQAQVIESVEQIRLSLLGNKDLSENSNRESSSISDDLTKDEESFPSSSLVESEKQEHPVKLKIELSRDSSAVDLTKDKISPIRFEAYESTGARVLEIIEPKENARQDSIDVSSIEIDDPKHHREEDDEDDLSLSERHLRENDFGKLHESHAMNSLDKIGQDRDLTFSPSTMSDSSLAHDLRSLSPIIHSSKTLPEFVESDDAGFSSMEPDKTPEKLSHLDTKSIDKNIIPSIVSPKIKVAELEIKTDCDWTIGSEKIAINEFVEPSLAFDKELDDYHSSIIMQQSMSSSHDESATRSSEDISTIDSVKESDNYESASISTRVNIIPPPNEREIEHEMVEDKLDISCQELVATLQREYEAKTPTDEKIPVTPRKLSESDSELELVEQSLENVKKIKILPSSFDEKSSELTEMIFDSGINENIQNIIPAAVEETYEEAIKEKKEKEEKEIDTQEDLKNKLHKDNELSGKKKYSEKNQNQLKNEISLKLKKEEIKNVDLSARYAITVLDEVVKKEINEIKESLEAAKQDLIEELSENSNTIFPIKESPSEFQFKLHPETISNDLPFLYEAPSTLEHDHGQLSDSPIAKPRMIEKEQSKIQKDKFYDDKEQQEEEEEDEEEEEEMEEAQEEGYEEDEESEKSSKIIDHVPVPASRSGSDPDKDKESSSSLSVPPKPAPRRRQKPSRGVRKLNTDISEGGGSSSESSNYQSCDYDIGSGSRPSSSDIEALQSAAGLLSGTVSEYETALMSIEHSTASRPTSQDYQSAMSTLSSRESMKSLNSFSSGRLGSIDATSEHTDTLVASEAELDKDEIDENLELVLENDDDDNIPLDGSFEKSTDGLPRTMKRSSEMIFEQLSEDQDSSSMAGQFGGSTDDQSTKVTSSIIISEDDDLKTSTVDILSEGISGKIIDSSSSEIKIKPIEAQSTGDDIDASELKMTSLTTADDNETLLLTKRSVLQQASMSTSSTSGMSIETVIEREKLDRNSPDSDSFELVDKPDIIDDFVVIEEVGKEAEEFDSEGKSITIKNVPYASMKKYDKDLENLIVIKQNDDSQLLPTKLSRNNDLFDFESEESPPQVSNDEQYSQSLSDEELDHKKWMEMQFQEQRNYELEYDRGPLEDIKEEEMADFEAGSSRFGSLGSHKGSIGSSGSMKGSYGAEYDVLAGKKQFSRSIENDNISMNSLQEFENMEFAIVGDNCRKLQTCGSQDSVNNGGSLPRRYITSRSGHGDDVSVSSLKDFEGLEKACREAHIIEIRAKEEEDLLDHESPENRFRLENLTRPRIITNDSIITATSTITTTTMTTTTSVTFNPGTSGSDDYEKRIMEIDEIIRIAQANVEKYDRQDDTTEDISQIEVTDIDKIEPPFNINLPLESDSDSLIKNRDVNAMETSTDSLEVDVDDEKKNLMCRSTDSLELKTTIDFPSLSYSDSLNNVKDGQTSGGQFNSERRISSDSLDMQVVDSSGHDENIHVKSSSSTEVAVKKNGKTIYTTTTDA
ncbi:ankyrin-2-like isoform X2 [Aphidius gifuensis]|uniref:ankyrin-2-like isoform X2 n=1 Tax=Aphidius gifuensis TaxID=684658 RepID=UPI001CDC0566|nr:ankyrin-2-like isoform X2 [Aphidius gifuensis]